MFSKFFIERPIFATVLALLFVVAGLVTLNILPVRNIPILRLLPCKSVRYIRVPMLKL